ncbi:MAG: hypothetical protein QG627_574 [Chlamydiota bacterium]|nr:hypothetical protein [Chlamydiota bacterium]
MNLLFSGLPRIIIEKYPRDPAFLLSNIARFTHMLKLTDILLEISNEKAYIVDIYINKFTFLEKEENSLLEKYNFIPK